MALLGHEPEERKVDARMTVQSEEAFAGGEPAISVRVVRGLIAAVEQAGVSRKELLLASGIDADELASSGARLPYPRLFQLCEVALELTGDAAFALHWAERAKERAFVPVSQLIANARTLRHAFSLLARFHRLLGDRVRHHLVEEGDWASVRMHRLQGASERMQRFAAELSVAGFSSLLGSYGVTPIRLRFAHPAPPYASEYARVLGEQVEFGQPFCEITFDRAMLDAPAPQADDALREALVTVAERRLLTLTERTAYAHRVRELLVRDGTPLRSDMSSVARALGLSVRSLRRRLAAEGKPYSQVVNEALATMAKHHLREERRSIQETAQRMGFSDATTFHRAFKRWTGMTPSVFRASRPDAGRS